VRQHRWLAGFPASQSSPGHARGGQAERNHFRIALGSAAETCAVLDLVLDEPGIERDAVLENQQKLRRIGAMLHRLTHPS